MADLDVAIRFLRNGSLEDAKKILLNFRQEDPDYLDALLYLVHISDIECDWFDRKNRVEIVQDLYVKSCLELGRSPKFPVCYLPFDVGDFKLVELATVRCKVYSEQSPLKLKYLKKKKLRVGFVSRDFRCHSNGVDLSPILKSCKESQIELYGYSFAEGEQGPFVNKKLKTYFDHFRGVSGHTLFDVANLISSDSIDILVDTTRNIEYSPEQLFFYRPAPIQVTGWGYGPSTGASVFDYFIADRKLVIAEEESFYTEKVVRLDYYNPVYSDANSRNIAISFQTPKNSWLTFGAFGATYKLRPELFDVWIRILSEISESRLIMIVDSQLARENLISRFKSSGLESKRLHIIDRLDLSSFSALLKEQVDILLDNPLLGGSFAFIQACKLGVPAITFEGCGFSSRGSASFGSVLGLESMVAKDLDDYQNIALQIARNGFTTKPISEVTNDDYGSFFRKLM